jgi:hypothetical protein
MKVLKSHAKIIVSHLLVIFSSFCSEGTFSALFVKLEKVELITVHVSKKGRYVGFVCVTTLTNF